MCGAKDCLQTKPTCKTNKAAMLCMKKIVMAYFSVKTKGSQTNTFKELGNTTTEDQLIDAHLDVFKRKNVSPQPKYS